jgi:hypothetical protein
MRLYLFLKLLACFSTCAGEPSILALMALIQSIFSSLLSTKFIHMYRFFWLVGKLVQMGVFTHLKQLDLTAGMGSYQTASVLQVNKLCTFSYHS